MVRKLRPLLVKLEGTLFIYTPCQCSAIGHMGKIIDVCGRPGSHQIDRLITDEANKCSRFGLERAASTRIRTYNLLCLFNIEVSGMKFAAFLPTCMGHFK